VMGSHSSALGLQTQQFQGINYQQSRSNKKCSDLSDSRTV
jgi:hypothetical protein